MQTTLPDSSFDFVVKLSASIPEPQLCHGCQEPVGESAYQEPCTEGCRSGRHYCGIWCQEECWRQAEEIYWTNRENG